MFFCAFLRIFIFIQVCVWLFMEARREPSRGISHKSVQAQTYDLTAAVVHSLAGVAGFSAITASGGNVSLLRLEVSFMPP